MNSNSKRVCVSVRLSTAEQTSHLPVRELEEYARVRSWEVLEIYREVMSGGGAHRPALDRLMSDARARKFKCFLVWKLDRFGRSLPDCLCYITTLG